MNQPPLPLPPSPPEHTPTPFLHSPPPAAPAPTPGSKHEMPAYVPASKDPRLDWLFKGLGAIGLAAIIGGCGWVWGVLHERLDKAEDDIHEIQLGDVEDHAATKAKLDILAEATKKQWEIISKNGRDISALKGQ